MTGSHAPGHDIIGRAADIARIVAWSEGDGPALLLLSGSAGIGKTTVWRAAIDGVAVRGAHILASAPAEAESRLSFSGLADLLTADFSLLRAALPPPQARALAVALRLEDPGDLPIDETAVARGALEAIRTLARQRGRVVLAIDDLRWLDDPSQAIVIYAARRIDPRDGVRILATHRSGTREPAGLERVPAIERLELGPLSVGAIHRIVRQHAGISLSRPRLLEIHAMTLGNPLHAVELARSAASGLDASGESLGSLFARRVAELPTPTRSALVLAAASADRSIDRLRSAWAVWPDGATPDSIAPEPFTTAIGAAAAADLVSIVGGRATPVHPLVAFVAYESADPADRRAAHRALADTATDEEERAVHLGRAVGEPDAAVAGAIESAARSVRVRGGRALSATLFESSATLTPPEDVEQVGRRRLAAAAAWFDAGDTHRVEEVLAPIVESWPAGPQRAEARWRLGIALDEVGRWPEATELWRAALEDTGDGASASGGDHALRSQIQCSLAITAMYTDSMAVAVDWAASAVPDAERSGDPAALARSLAVHAFVLAMAGRSGGEEMMDRALAIEATVDDHLGEWSPASLAAECARHTGRIRDALGHYATVLDRATTRGDANVEQWAAFGLASAAILVGDMKQASELADVVFDIGEQTDVMRIPARSLRAHVDANLGEVERARSVLAEAESMARAGDEAAHLYGCHVVLGTIETCAGDPRAAARAFRDARELAGRLGIAHATVLRAHLLEAEVASAAGETDQADEALTAFHELAGDTPPAWTVPLVRRVTAAVSAARGDVRGAVAELEAAIADDVALPPDVARARLALAGVLRRDRRLRQAREAAEAARTAFAELGMPPFVALADRELERIPGRRAGGTGELTAAEARIAALVAEGRSNREVAAELVVSVKTVEVTLTRVYEKLGLRSRTELAAQFRAMPAKD